MDVFKKAIEVARELKLRYVQHGKAAGVGEILPPMIVSIRDGYPEICVLAPAMTQQLGLWAVMAICLTTTPSEIVFILDYSEGDSQYLIALRADRAQTLDQVKLPYRYDSAARGLTWLPDIEEEHANRGDGTLSNPVHVFLREAVTTRPLIEQGGLQEFANILGLTGERLANCQLAAVMDVLDRLGFLVINLRPLYEQENQQANVA
jgi:hypothetical protein